MFLYPYKGNAIYFGHSPAGFPCALATAKFWQHGLSVMAGSLILCIDDEALGLQIRKVVLERVGYRVLTALDGVTGLTLFGEHPVDAVILDYAMPGMNGGQVAAAMRKMRINVPILLLSAYVNLPPDVIQSVDFTLMKGDRPEMLMEKVQEMLALRRRSPRSAGGSD
jgi:CheY-like chemotaxis protein